jgi:hypothetical protein
MKKASAAAIAVALGLLFGTVAYAVSSQEKPADVNALKQFQKETLPLRDELAVKSLDLQNEYAKENPDQATIAKLQDEIAGLREKIAAAAQKNGLPNYGPGYGRGYGMRGYGPGYGMRGGYGHGWMMGQGYGRGGYGPGYCPMW